MAEAPVVRDLNAVVGQIGQSVIAQKQQIDADIAANQQYGEAQIAGLEAKKVRAFGDIEQGAQNKNMFFSGFSADSQAKYTADTYLPALAGLQQTIAQTRSQLMQSKNQLDTDVFNKAWQSVEQDRTILADWNKMTAQQQFEASEAEKQRVFTAQQNEKDRANSLASAAAGRSGGGGGGSSANPTNAIGSFLDGKKGKDGKVSPATYQAGKQQWVAAGGSADDFNATFSGYINGKHYQDYIGGWGS